MTITKVPISLKLLASKVVKLVTYASRQLSSNTIEEKQKHLQRVLMIKSMCSHLELTISDFTTFYKRRTTLLKEVYSTAVVLFRGESQVCHSLCQSQLANNILKASRFLHHKSFKFYRFLQFYYFFQLDKYLD